MDFLNKAFAQFNDLFRSMTPGGRITRNFRACDFTRLQFDTVLY